MRLLKYVKKLSVCFRVLKHNGIIYEKIKYPRNQCANLCKKIEHVTKVFDQLMTCTNDGLQFGLLLSELFFTINKSYFLVENCGKENWCEKAIFLLNNKEAFRELLLNLKRCCDIASDLLSKHYSNKLEAYTFATFNVATQDELKEDVEFLQKKLIQVNGEEDFEYFGLAKHLLQRYEDLLCVDGSCGKVYKSKWFGLVCATKKMNIEFDKMFIKEVSILASMSHPNLIIYYFAMKDVSYIFLIDIMYQIAKRMCYLYNMYIVHRGLKPENILVNIVESKIMNKIFRHIVVKVIDFRILRYMALEALRNKFELREMCQFEADVYSFAMICSKILSKKDPFYDVHEVKGILDRIEKGERPNLPSNCEDLIELIQECWRLNPLHQPKFANVCERLESLKKKYLIGIVNTYYKSYRTLSRSS
uniref:Protein kinase domain-containing protein n=1 Tax=Physcomitrium patens TaxID=3218 RepID=A0A7I4BJG8_PHYPA